MGRKREKESPYTKACNVGGFFFRKGKVKPLPEIATYSCLGASSDYIMADISTDDNEERDTPNHCWLIYCCLNYTLKTEWLLPHSTIEFPHLLQHLVPRRSLFWHSVFKDCMRVRSVRSRRYIYSRSNITLETICPKQGKERSRDWGNHDVWGMFCEWVV